MFVKQRMNLYKKLSKHPREHEVQLDRKAVVIGGTGTTEEEQIEIRFNV